MATASASAPSKDKPGRERGMVNIFSTRTAERCATHLLPHIKSHHHILDVGCGPGSITLDLAKLVPQGRVIGVDVIEGRLAFARDLAKQQGVTNVEFRLGNAEDLKDFESETFDIVHAHQVLLHVLKPLQAIREMRRVVKSGGVMSTRDVTRQLLLPHTPFLEEMNFQKFDQLQRSRGANPEFGEKNHIFAHEAGFDWDKIEISSWAWECSGEQGRRLWVNGAKDAFREAGVKAGLVTDEDMDEAKRQWEEWEKKPEGRFIILDGALLCWK